MSLNRFSFALNAPDNERFLVRKGVDMLAMMKALAVRHQPMALYFGETDDFVRTGLLGINPAFEELIFSPGDDPAALERLISAGSFGVETVLDSIRILFIATHAELTQFRGQPALRARIPEVLARMQRRQAVRVELDKDTPSFCQIRLNTEPLHELKLQVHDLSIGGLGMIVPAGEKALTQGKTFHDCNLELPGIGVMRCVLNVVYRSEPQANGTSTRIGCHFIDLAALSREQVRSYVARVERVRLATGSGSGAG
jgi:c-di-GMP-binding flagellar brake protein YcgR